MPDLRTNKSIAERFDVEIHKRPERGLRRWRRFIAYACVAVPLLLVGLYEVLGDGRAYWAGPLTDVHQSALVDSKVKRSEGCATCHTKTAQPLWRLVTMSSRACSVDDESCLNCHFKNDRLDEETRVEKARFGHSPNMVEQDLQSCAVCHEEHRGQAKLKEVADVRCVACHGNLQTMGDEPTFHDRVPSFAAHPEFAASRFRGEVVVAGNDPPGPKHAVFGRAEMKADHLLDKTQLHFNHRTHLREDGVLLPASRHEGGADEKNVETDARDLRWKKLVCTDCHKVDAGGEYIAPVTYAQHCSSCHPLAYSERINGSGLGPLSHLELSRVYVEAKGRLREYAAKQISAPRSLDPSDDLPRLPNKSGSTATPANSVDELVASLWPDLREVIHSGCAHCHVLKPKGIGGSDGELVVTPPQIPSRWLPHSRFNHDKHKEYACVSCHDPEAHKYDEVLRTGEGGDRDLPSTRTSDILMPSVAVCQKCHAKGSQPEWQVRARADCVECHNYHPQTHAK